MFTLLAVPCLLSAQAVLYQENFGVPSANTLIQNYSGWQDTSVLYTGDGTCDVRASSASSGYGGASGGGNVMINDTVKWFQISRLNTAADTNLSLYCGLRKTASENGSNLVVEASADSFVWTRLYLEDTLPAGTGTSGWYRVRYRQVPSCPNLHLRFSNLARVDYRLDDVFNFIYRSGAYLLDLALVKLPVGSLLSDLTLFVDVHFRHQVRVSVYRRGDGCEGWDVRQRGGFGLLRCP